MQRSSSLLPRLSWREGLSMWKFEWSVDLNQRAFANGETDGFPWCRWSPGAGKTERPLTRGSLLRRPTGETRARVDHWWRSLKVMPRTTWGSYTVRTAQRSPKPAIDQPRICTALSGRPESPRFEFIYGLGLSNMQLTSWMLNTQGNTSLEKMQFFSHDSSKEPPVDR